MQITLTDAERRAIRYALALDDDEPSDTIEAAVERILTDRLSYLTIERVR